MVDFLSGMFGGGYEKEAAQKDIAAAQAYQGQAMPALQQAYQTGQTNLGQAVGAYNPLVNLGAQYSQAAPTYLGAMGVGTPQQVQAAQSAFTNAPGYQFALNQAQQAAERAAAAGGMTASGNLIDAEQRNAIGLQNQQYQNWVDNLQKAGQMGLGATQAGAQGQATGYTNLANLAQTYGENQANVYGNVEGATIGANNLAAQGQAAGAKNLLGAGLQLATLGLTAPTGGLSNTLFGKAFSGLSNMFGGDGGGAATGYGGSPYYGPAAPQGGSYSLSTAGYSPQAYQLGAGMIPV
jgi:hypothetical protein